MKIKFIIGLVLCLSLWPGPVSAEDWPRFRGPDAAGETFAWYQQRTSSYNPSQIVYGDYLYTLYDQGFLTCHNALTGEEIYGKQRLRPSGSFTASPIAFNGRLFCLSEDGLTYVVKPGPEFDILATNPLDERCLSSPAIADDKLLIRTATKLYCLSESETPDEDNNGANLK